MNNPRGFISIAILLGVLGIIVLGGAGYIAMNPQVLQTLGIATTQKDDGVQTEAGDHPEVDHNADEGLSADAKVTIAWRFEKAGETDSIPYTKVFATINGKTHEVGTFAGSCSEVGASGGIDGKGLIAGELSAVQCWYAGGGNEIGVFANEDGGFEIMVGGLSEGEEGVAMFRGDFKVRTDIRL